ncbi:conjugal transfer relaxosome DNA-binding protein TraM [Buttiauxella ferragutiae]|uniref:conjugal transfer relaxosome DNA-binding protein TraM n=1 Tax=Buttiauxella ferragutiae TaxID=82989 RepID=UPI0035263AF8
MAKLQVYASDEVVEKINAIIEKRRAEGAKEKDVSFSSVASMLVELGLRVYEAQMERKESGFNQMLFNKTLLENTLKTQLIASKLLGMTSLSPHLTGNEKFIFSNMVDNIREDVKEMVAQFFPTEDETPKINN